MKKLLLPIALLWLFAGSIRASELNPFETFRAGLNAFQTNGPAALLNAWYAGDTETKVLEIRVRLAALSERLGPVVETEAFAPKSLGKRVTRMWGVIYFKKRPLWIRADYYVADGAGGFIDLDFSTNPDDILPVEIGVR